MKDSFKTQINKKLNLLHSLIAEEQKEWTLLSNSVSKKEGENKMSVTLSSLPYDDNKEYQSERFYRDAKRKMIEREIVDQKRSLHFIQLSNKDKVSDQSKVILKKKIQIELATVLEGFQWKQGRSFEEVGRLLTELDFFLDLKFDKNFQFMSVASQKSLLEEDMIVHEFIFQSCQLISQDEIKSNHFFAFMLILLDPTVSSSEILQNLLEIHQRHNYDENKIIYAWRLIQKRITLRHKKKRRRKVQKIKEYPFKPSLTPESKKLAQNFHKKIYENFQLKDKSEYFKILEEIRQNKIQKKRDKAQQLREKELTFEPRRRSLSGKPRRAYPSKAQYQEIVKKQKFKKEIHEEFENQRKLMRELEEQEQCTFTPKINKDFSIEKLKGKLPANYGKFVGRVRRGIRERSEQREREEFVSRGEKLEWLKSLKKQVPRCYYKKKEKKRRKIVELDIQVRNGLTGKLVLHEGEDPFQKTKNFSKTFQLKEEQEEGLILLLQSYLKNFNQITSIGKSSCISYPY